MRSIYARVGTMPAGALAVSYVLDADLDRLTIPPPRPARMADQLWQHTCFELFVRCAGSSAYHEFNFAPSGEWAAYAFNAYREGVPLADATLDPRVTVRSSPGKLEVDAVMRLDSLSFMRARSSLSVAVSAVIEDCDGGLSYWALAHPAGKPDFHHADSFALELTHVLSNGIVAPATPVSPFCSWGR